MSVRDRVVWKAYDVDGQHFRSVSSLPTKMASSTLMGITISTPVRATFSSMRSFDTTPTAKWSMIGMVRWGSGERWIRPSSMIF